MKNRLCHISRPHDSTVVAQVKASMKFVAQLDLIFHLLVAIFFISLAKKTLSNPSCSTILMTHNPVCISFYGDILCVFS